MSDAFAESRVYSLDELLGPELAARFLELQKMGKKTRSSAQHLEYSRLTRLRDTKRRDAYFERKAAQRLKEAALPTPTTPIAPPDNDPQPTLELEERAEAPTREEGAPPTTIPPPSAPPPAPPIVEALPDPLPPPLEPEREPDPPEQIATRKREVAGYIREGLDEWGGWIRGQGVWTAPRLAKTWISRFGAVAAEGYGLLDHEPRKEIALGAFVAATFLLFVPFTILALRNSRTPEARARAVADLEREEAERKKRDAEEAEYWGQA